MDNVCQDELITFAPYGSKGTTINGKLKSILPMWRISAGVQLHHYIAHPWWPAKRNKSAAMWHNGKHMRKHAWIVDMKNEIVNVNIKYWNIF